MRRTLLASWTVVLVAALSLGCGKSKDEKPKPPAKSADAKPAGDKPEQAPAKPDAAGAKVKADAGAAASKNAGASGAKAELSLFMQKHFGSMSQARRALQDGKLGAFKTEMDALAKGQVPAGQPDKWLPHFKKLTAAAAVAAAAQDLSGAGQALGAAATVCGDCHRSILDTTRVFSTGQAPPVTDTLKGYMARHAWAATEMWAGIFGPDDDAWGAAVKVLDETPIHKAPGADKWPRAALDLANDVAALAKLGLAAKPAQRADVFGTFVTTCASCHTSIRNAK